MSVIITHELVSFKFYLENFLFEIIIHWNLERKPIVMAISII